MSSMLYISNSYPPLGKTLHSISVGKYTYVLTDILTGQAEFQVRLQQHETTVTGIPQLVVWCSVTVLHQLALDNWRIPERHTKRQSDQMQRKTPENTQEM